MGRTRKLKVVSKKAAKKKSQKVKKLKDTFLQAGKLYKFDLIEDSSVYARLINANKEEYLAKDMNEDESSENYGEIIINKRLVIKINELESL